LLTIFYHDPIEVDPAISWTGLHPELSSARRLDIRTINDKAVTALFEYARPDAVLAFNKTPILSIEQTQMNPSGHNIPQRFSFHVRAAELGIPSILYYPEYSRRTFSDPNVRYINVRVPLAQLRITDLYRIPALSVFWPTDNSSKLPATGQASHQRLTDIVMEIIEHREKMSDLMNSPIILNQLNIMRDVADKYAPRYRKNTSVRAVFNNGFPTSITRSGISIDPPNSTKLVSTLELIKMLNPTELLNHPANFLFESLLKREYSLLFTGTANHSRTDSEHPWPGYLTLFDLLYLRSGQGKTPSDRKINLVYKLPVELDIFSTRVDQTPQPTATHIVDVFSDVILLNGGFILGEKQRVIGKQHKYEIKTS